MILSKEFCLDVLELCGIQACSCSSEATLSSSASTRHCSRSLLVVFAWNPAAWRLGLPQGGDLNDAEIGFLFGETI